jgi:hypothetical protein
MCVQSQPVLQDSKTELVQTVPHTHPTTPPPPTTPPTPPQTMFYCNSVVYVVVSAGEKEGMTTSLGQCQDLLQDSKTELAQTVGKLHATEAQLEALKQGKEEVDGTAVLYGARGGRWNSRLVRGQGGGRWNSRLVQRQGGGRWNSRLVRGKGEIGGTAVLYEGKGR